MSEPARLHHQRMTAPIERRTIEERVADALRQRFLAGEFAHGERLTEQRLAQQLSVSRGPVRAALHRLAQENLVVLRPYRGWEVARPTAQDAWELSTLRCGLEELACRLAAARIDAASAARLRQAQRTLNESCTRSGTPAIADVDFDLHRLIVELAGNERLRQSYMQLEQQVRFLVEAVNVPFSPADIASSHDDMVEALCRGDGEAAAAACREHHAVLIASSLPRR